MSVSISPLQACRTCEHGRNLYQNRPPLMHVARCDKNLITQYRFPRHEQDDQHGFYRHCADWKCRTEVIDAEKEENV